MTFAIVDIETTGSHAHAGAITEIAILIHDGQQVLETFQTLVNPERPIPHFITGLTGIDNQMVADAPTLRELAPKLHALLAPHTFVAHNVNFDYTFLKVALEREGFSWQAQRLCTVRLARKAFPGLRSYSLGRLCEQLGIPIAARHRAFGDAEATAVLFGRIFQQAPELILGTGKKKKQYAFLPPNFSPERFEALPEETGIYYFLNAKGDILYIGKALNIKKRFQQHFASAQKDPGKLALAADLHDVAVELTGSELLAYLLELQGIKKHWPPFNAALKRPVQQWGLYRYQDHLGYSRFSVAKAKKGFEALLLFDSHSEAWSFWKKAVQDFGLCPKLSGVQKTPAACYDRQAGSCAGACEGAEPVAIYEEKVFALLQRIQSLKGQLLLQLPGRKAREQAFIRVENGCFTGYAFLNPEEVQIQAPEELSSYLQAVPAYPESGYIMRSFLPKLPPKAFFHVSIG
ncbi:DNA polymerase III subunit epsilon [Nitritalea halalkaliphila LW7]|uniref:DNA polymerase III subunit epsilon n=1 Tax=Nitritalea halalkaliphila LW7 TaxID=1189621 RepID=I5BZL8_9BACT|nr:exonuclease domain-containing protein [Nitritalea halalkaliphila]EIM75020.1 DNA polymerase III subunit epsilon [Nitritalea halalkaliphila LW7]